MRGEEILRLVDTIHRDRDIDKEIIFLGVEAAIQSALKKKLGEFKDTRVEIDRVTGDVQAFEGLEPISPAQLGRIAATTGKQVLLQKIREAERDVIYAEYSDKVGTLVTGVVQRFEGPNIIVNLGKAEGFLPKSQQPPGEKFRVGERIRALVTGIEKNQNKVKITLSRAHPDLVRALFELEVPEIAEKTIEIMEIAREPGYRTKIAVTTYDPNVDCVGACVGVRGSRIKNIVDELFGEKIDIVRWNDSIEVLIMNALKPAEICSMDLDFENKKAIVYVRPEQQSLAIGRRGQNVRLASKLSGWELDIVTVSEEVIQQMKSGEPSDTVPSVEQVFGGERVPSVQDRGDSAPAGESAAPAEGAPDEGSPGDAGPDSVAEPEAPPPESAEEERAAPEDALPEAESDPGLMDEQEVPTEGPHREENHR